MGERLMIVVGAPPDSVDAVLAAIAGAGGGVLGNYTHCAFTNPGNGRFKPGERANPHVGAKDMINSVDEVRIETFCDRERAKAVVAAIRTAHPYEEPVIYLIPLLAEGDL
jgi:hypothetical protein